MGCFDGHQVYLELGKLSYKQKHTLSQQLSTNGAKINHSISKNTTLVIVDTGSGATNISNYKLSQILRFSAPVVDVSYVQACLAAKKLIDHSGFLVNIGVLAESSVVEPQLSIVDRYELRELETPPKVASPPCKIWKSDEPGQPSFPTDFHIVKIDLFKKNDLYYILELQMPTTLQDGDTIRVSSRQGQFNTSVASEEFIYCNSFETAISEYKKQYQKISQSYQKNPHIYEKLGLKSVVIPEAMQLKLPPEVQNLVIRCFKEIQESLATRLNLGPDGYLSRESVHNAAACLRSLRPHLESTGHNKQQIEALSYEYFSLLPPPTKAHKLVNTLEQLERESEFCQQLTDLLEINEVIGPSSNFDQLYKSLNCNITVLTAAMDQYSFLMSHIKKSSSVHAFDVVNIFQVEQSYPLLTNTITSQAKLLFHGSRLPNWVGILKKGLTVPVTGVQRTDKGMLGAGIYFADDPSVAIKYSGSGDGTAFLAIAQVSLGNVKSVTKVQPNLTAPPSGFHSVLGVKHTPSKPSEFIDNEYVVYDPAQVKLMYLVEVRVKGSQTGIKNGTDFVGFNVLPQGVKPEEIVNDNSNKPSGLIGPKGALPLLSVNVRAQLLDMASRVVLILHYNSPYSENIEAKYVFPHTNSAVVSGLEIFVGDKHIVAKVKENDTAQKEYREAVEQGHGAYLMSQDDDDRLSLSIGNLPPKTDVFIKVTYLTELVPQKSDLVFNLPNSLFNRKAGDTSTIGFSLEASVSLAYDIVKIVSPSHKIDIKQTATKATVQFSQTNIQPEPFVLRITQSDNHSPRMWLENFNGHYAAMLSFFPDLSYYMSSSVPEIVILADCSASMQGNTFEKLRSTVLNILAGLTEPCSFNIITCGTVYSRLFVDSVSNTPENIKVARDFISSKSIAADMGGTELWTALLSVALMSKARSNFVGVPKTKQTTAVILLTDGEINDQNWTVKLLQENTKYMRVFPIGIGCKSQHTLRSIAHAGGGISEFHSSSDIAQTVNVQLERAYAASKIETRASVKLTWDTHTPPVTLAPHKLPPLLHNERYVVYAMLDGPCLSAKLSSTTSTQGDISWKISTNDMAILKGDFIHKMACKAIIKDWEEGIYDCDGVAHAAAQRDRISELIQLSIKYNILTQWTSFVAVEERNDRQTNKASFTIVELLRLQSVDELSSISWTPVELPPIATKEPSTPARQVGLDDFDLLSVIGKGSFGKELQVREKDTGKILAMTVSNNTAKNSKHDWQAIVQRLQHLRHPFIASLLHSFQTDTKSYMLSEYPSGGELFYHLCKHKTFELDWVRFYGAELLLCLEYLHEHGIAIETKPEDIHLWEDGHICVKNFAALELEPNDFDGSTTHTYCGTPEYMAPEALRGTVPKRGAPPTGPAGVRRTAKITKATGGEFAANWWSYGTLLYEMLTGLPPFYNEDIQVMYQAIISGLLKFPPKMDIHVQSLLIQLLQVNPDDRLTNSNVIKQHPFFSQIDWNLLMQKKVDPPIVPKQKDQDTCYFDPEFVAESPQDDFAGFTYTAEPTDFSGFTFNATPDTNAFADFTYVSPNDLTPKESSVAAPIESVKIGQERITKAAEKSFANTPSSVDDPFAGFTYTPSSDSRVIARLDTTSTNAIDINIVTSLARNDPEPVPSVTLSQIPSKSESDAARLRALFAQMEVFKGIKPAELAILADAAVEMQATPYDVVIRQGDFGDQFFLVEDGELVVLENGVQVAKMGPGRYFGEQALLYNAPRSATISAFTYCTLWAINKDVFTKVLKNYFMKKRHLNEPLINSLGALSFLQPYQRTLIVDVVTVRTFQSGEYVVRGELEHALYIVLQGKVSASYGFGEERTLGERGCFGSMSLGQERPSSVRAVGFVQLLCVDARTMDRILPQYSAPSKNCHFQVESGFLDMSWRYDLVS